MDRNNIKTLEPCKQKTMKKYIFEIGRIENKKIVIVWMNGDCNCQKAEDKLLPSSNPRLLSITKRMPMNGIKWR